MAYTGGFRTRLISDSVFHLINGVLDDLGWFSPSRPYRPIEVRTHPVERDEEIPLNTLVVSESITTDDEAELGSNLGEVRTTYYVDFYAETESLGKQLINDVRDILKGRHPAQGRTQTNIPVYDWSMATPTLAFYCDVDDVLVDRATDFPKPWGKHWWTVRFDVVDHYTGAE